MQTQTHTMTSPVCSALLSTYADSVLASSSYIDNSLTTTTTSMTTPSVSSPAMTLYKSAVRVCDDGVGGDGSSSSSTCCCCNSAEHVNVCRTCYRSDSRIRARQLQQLQQQAYRDDVISNSISYLVPAYNINTVNNNNNNSNSNSNSSGGSAVVCNTSHVRSNTFDFVHDADLLGALDSIVLTAIDDDDDDDKNSVGDDDEDRAATLSERVVGGHDGASDAAVASSPSSTRHAMLPTQSLPRRPQQQQQQQQQHATARRVQLCTPTSSSSDRGWGRAGDSMTTATVVAQHASAHGDAAASMGDDGSISDERGHTHVLQTLERLSLLQQRSNDDDATTTTATAAAAAAAVTVTRTSQANDSNNVSCSASNVSSRSNAVNDVVVNNTTTTTMATPAGTLCISDEHVRSNLFICGLAPDVDDATLRDVFGRYGDIESAKVMLNIHTGRSRCIAFVKFTDVQHAATALQELNGATLHDHVMTVRIANSRAAYLPGAPTNKTFVRNVPVTVTRASLQAYFSTFGDVVDVSIHADTARLSGVAGASATRTPLAVGMGNNNKGGSMLVGQDDGGYGVQGVLMPPHALVATTSSCSTPATGNTTVTAATTTTSSNNSTEPTAAAAAAATAHNIVFVTFTTKEAAARAATATHLAMPFPECCGVPLLAKVAEDSARRVERLTRRYRASNGNNNSSGGAGGSALFTSSATLPVTAAAAAACNGQATMTTTAPAGAFAAVPQLPMSGRLAVPTPPSMSVNSGGSGGGGVAYAACEPAALLYGTRPATTGMLHLAGVSCVNNNSNGSVSSYHDCVDGAHMCVSGAAGPAATVLHSALPRMVQQPRQQTQQQQQSMQMTPLYMSATPLQRANDGVAVTRMPAPVYGVDGRPLTAVYSTEANTANTHLQLTQAFAPTTAAQQQQQQQQQLAQLIVSGVVPQSFMLWPSPSTAAPQQQQQQYAQVGLPGGMRVMYTPLASATPTATFAPAASQLSVPYYFVMNTP